MARVQSEPVRLDGLLAEVRGDGDGAVALFVGTVRDENRGRRVSHLEYHAYSELAESELRRIELEAIATCGLTRALVVHRTGRLGIGEVSVVVAVAAPHRAQAFDGCRFAIEALKRRVPIWKKEFFDGGECWIEGAPDQP